MSVPVKLKARLKTIKNLNSIFNALQVITTARIQKVRKLHESSRRYLAAIEGAASRLDLSKFSTGDSQGKILVILLSTNRGLCGAFNQRLFFRLQSLIKEKQALGREMEFIVFGKRGCEFLRKIGINISRSFTNEDLNPKLFSGLAKDILALYLKKNFSEVHLIHNQYKSVVRQEPYARMLLPREGTHLEGGGHYILEPSAPVASDELFERELSAKLYHLYIDSQLGELSSRMYTLKGAIENSRELIDKLVLQLNKIRQQSITQELLEIISSSECVMAGRG